MNIDRRIKITKSDKKRILYLRKQKHTIAYIAKEFNVSTGAIWLHLQEPYYLKWLSKKRYKEYAIEYKKRNKDKISIGNKKYRKRHPEKIKASNNKWNKIWNPINRLKIIKES
jgi:hypothetical protein